jgi:hypothetical protein
MSQLIFADRLLQGQPRTLDVFIRKDGNAGYYSTEDYNKSRVGPDKVQYQPSIGQSFHQHPNRSIILSNYL